ncbi:NAD-dependent epimerase/dehydratase family protein [Streptomyces buecherae]|uniref:NAD-dependent epimerase/dehydratase family protein n=1 Tax=Streptomyces buecherae TaxID=2763006 RepID=UPI0036612609
MKVVIFGATGMVGQGVLRECLLDSRVESVLAVGRTSLGRPHPKLREVIHGDFTDFTPVGAELAGLDACFWCLGISASGKSAAEYRRVTYDYTLAGARELAERSPGLTFTYVSGEGTDGTGRSRARWARVKGETENALLAMDGLDAYLFRPNYIHPVHGERSKTPLYRAAYAATSWAYPVLRRVAPGQVTSTERLGQAMIAVVGRRGGGERVLRSREINRIAGGAGVE